MSCKPCNSFGSNCTYHKNKFGDRFVNLEYKRHNCKKRGLVYDPVTKNCVPTLESLRAMCKSQGLILDLKTRKCKHPMKSTSFGVNCHQEHKTKFGMNVYNMRSVASKAAQLTDSRCTKAGLNEFGVKASSVKGYSSLTKQHLTSFYAINGIDTPMSATKDQLYNNLKGVYSGLTPADIKQSVATKDTIANIRASKQRQKDAEERAKIEALEEKQRLKRAEIKKITYASRAVPKEFEFVSKRLPAGSKVKRLTRPEVKQADIDDLSDMFSAARASPDEMSDLLTKLSVKFGKNKFGA